MVLIILVIMPGAVADGGLSLGKIGLGLVSVAVFLSLSSSVWDTSELLLASSVVVTAVVEGDSSGIPSGMLVPTWTASSVVTALFRPSSLALLRLLLLQSSGFLLRVSSLPRRVSMCTASEVCGAIMGFFGVTIFG